MAQGNSSAGGGSASCSTEQTGKIATLAGGFRASEDERAERWGLVDANLQQLDSLQAVFTAIESLVDPGTRDQAPDSTTLCRLCDLGSSSLQRTADDLYGLLTKIRTEEAQ